MSRWMWIAFGAVVAGVVGAQWLAPHHRAHDGHGLNPPVAVSESLRVVVVAVTGMT